MTKSTTQKLMIGATFAAASTALTGCVSLPGGYGQPYRAPVTALPPAPIQPQAHTPYYEALPAGVERVAYYGTERPGTIMVDIAARKLYFSQGGGTALSYPIGAPRNGADIPPAFNTVTRKAVNPTWTPTANMRRKNPDLPQQVRGGVPENPLGVRALYLGDTLFRIHGTNAPESIGTAASSGCIRMLNNHVIDLYERVPVGTEVLVYRNAPVPGIGNAPYRSYQPY